MTIQRADLKHTDFSEVDSGERIAPVTPGDVLREEFMEPMGLSARGLAKAIDVPPNRITEILGGKRAITAKTAILLGRHFGNSPRFWMNLQVAYDLAVAEQGMVARRLRSPPERAHPPSGGMSADHVCCESGAARDRRGM
jgi:addiction module HigA family antidote